MVDPDKPVVPYGFFYDGGCVQAEDKDTDCTSEVKGFPMFFDVSFNDTRMEEFLTLIQDGGYIDTYTTSLQMWMPLLSFEFGKYTLVKITLAPFSAGGWTMEYEVITIDPSIHYPQWFSRLLVPGVKVEPMNSQDRIRATFEVLHILCLLYLMFVEVREFAKEFRRHGHPLFYIIDFGNLIDLMSLTTQTAALLTFMKIYELTLKLSEEIADAGLTYEPLLDPNFSVARMNQVNHNMASFQHLLRKSGCFMLYAHCVWLP